MANRCPIILCLLLLSFLLSSCAEREDWIVAEVGGRAITANDLEMIFFVVPIWSPEQVDSAKTEALNELIENKLFALEGERMGYGETEEITRNLDYVKRRAMVGQLYRKEVLERVSVDEEEMKRFYGRLGQEVKARHILVSSQEAADSLYRELTKENGSNFENLAKEHSLDEATRERGGDLGWLGWGKMPDEFQEVAFSLRIGETGTPVNTRQGYHIIKVEDRRKVDRKPYEEERKRIRQQLETAKLNRLSSEYLGGVKKEAKIEVDEDVLEILVDKSPEQEGPVFTPSPSPAIDEEDKGRILVRSTLGEWTVARVLEAAEKSPFPLSFTRPDEARNHLETLVADELLARRAKSMRLDRSRRVRVQVQGEVDSRMARKFYREEIDSKARVSEGELTEYYKSHIEEYSKPEKVWASEILVETKEEAERILTSLRKGADFAELASEKSIHWSKVREGFLGPFARGRFPEVEDAAFSLSPGEISGIIETKNGFAILKVSKKEKGKVDPYQQVRNRVKETLLRDKREKLIQGIASRLKKRYRVVIHKENLRLVGSETER